MLKWLLLPLLIGAVFALFQTGLNQALRAELAVHLQSVDSLPPNKTFDAAYILGGGQESLRAKYRTAAKLYGQARFDKVYILSRPGHTEYNSTLGRNLSNDEWSLMVLERYGVPQQAVKAIPVDDGFFGTYSEARCVSRLARQKGWDNLLLITSPHHTRRVRASFSHFLEEDGIDLRVIGSRNQADLLELALEYIKLQVYRLLLIR